MVAGQEYGVLEEAARPSSESDRVTVAEVLVRDGRRIAVVYATHPVTGVDGTALRDEHSRPLRFVYGYVAPAGTVDRPVPADLARARAAGLDRYREFLADEEGATVTAAPRFPRSNGAAPAATPVRETTRAATSPARPATRNGAALRKRVGLASAAVAVVLAGLLAIALGRCGGASAPPPAPSTPPSVSVTVPIASPGSSSVRRDRGE
jgi:hypothetical protein